MSNMIVMPMILPIVTAIILVFIREHIVVQRIIAILTMLFIAFVSIVLLEVVQDQGIQRLDFSGWLPPFGILFVADSFALLLVTAANIVTIICLLYAYKTVGRAYEGMFFYPLVLLLVAGVNGSFLTGDIFNLFVCFEVMLLASYALIALGGGKKQLRESLKYVLINIVGSWLFLVALAFLYGAVKTLNMAHISERVATTGQDPLITTIALVFFLVFSLKAGLLLFYWLPGSYSVPVTAIQALFAALLTKVGIYALFRTFTLMFPNNDAVFSVVIGIFAVITIILGCFGALAGKDVRSIAAYNVIIGVGFILTALSIGTEEAFAGAIYYLIHDIFAKALLFLLIGTMVMLTGEIVVKKMSGLIRLYPLFGWSFFILMLALAGIPPLSGFLGKVLISQSAIAVDSYILLAVGLGSSVIVLYSLLRIFLASFMGEATIPKDNVKPLHPFINMAFIFSVALLVGLGIGAEWIADYVTDAAKTLANPQIYIEAVLDGFEEGNK